MAKVDGFLESTMPLLAEAETALLNGDAGLRSTIWSHTDPVTLFGAAVTKSGWGEIGLTFDWLASRFSNCESFEYEVIAADVSDELAYVVGIEHKTVSIGGAPPVSYSLRVTTIFRREDGEWKVVHRHGDPYDTSAEGIVADLSATDTPRER